MVIDEIRLGQRVDDLAVLRQVDGAGSIQRPLDVGTTKICAVIAEPSGNGGIDVIGVGSAPSRGLRRGVVVNIDSTVEAIKQAVAASSNPALARSFATSRKISSTRGWMISESTWRESSRGFRPPTDGTSTVSCAGTRAVSAQPKRFFSSSASATGVRRPTAMSLVM